MFIFPSGGHVGALNVSGVTLSDLALMALDLKQKYNDQEQLLSNQAIEIQDLKTQLENAGIHPPTSSTPTSPSLTSSTPNVTSNSETAKNIRVPFTAGLSFAKSYNFDSIVFDNALSNVGSAYDPSTGTFVAPVSGVYAFSFFAQGRAGEL